MRVSPLVPTGFTVAPILFALDTFFNSTGALGYERLVPSHSLGFVPMPEAPAQRGSGFEETLCEGVVDEF